MKKEIAEKDKELDELRRMKEKMEWGLRDEFEQEMEKLKKDKDKYEKLYNELLEEHS